MDEVAAQVKADPVEYRLRHLRDPRLRAVVQAAAKAANWQARPSPRVQGARSGAQGEQRIAQGRGIACVLYEGDNGYCAMVAEVDVHLDSGRVDVTRLMMALDSGPISNPDGLRNQAEGGALHGVSRALFEEVTWDHEKVTSIDWRHIPDIPRRLQHSEARDGVDQHDGRRGLRRWRNIDHGHHGCHWQRHLRCHWRPAQAVPFTPERVKAALV